MSGRSPDLQGTGIVILDDQIVQQLPIGSRDIHIIPPTGMFFKKRTDFLIDDLLVIALGETIECAHQ
jgi:hypothetical protein